VSQEVTTAPIETSGNVVVPAGATVYYDSPVRITLREGFRTQAGGVFEATLTGATPQGFTVGAPRGFGAINITSTSCTLVWSQPDDLRGVTGYKISITGLPDVQLGNTTSYSLIGLRPDTIYHLQIWSIDQNGNVSPGSASSQITTPAGILDSDGDGLDDDWEMKWFGSLSQTLRGTQTSSGRFSRYR
jgi:hypothetical protein